MNDLLLELAAMAKRFCEIWNDHDSGLCAIGWSLDGPYVQLTEEAFKREFQEFSVKDLSDSLNQEIFTVQDGVRFLALERKEVPCDEE